MADPEKTFPLADLIDAIGAELRESQRRARTDDQPDLLKLRECTVELGITWEKKGDAGFDVQVFKLGGGVSKQDIETISVTLEPFEGEAVVLEE
jgi:hypothetical protein